MIYNNDVIKTIFINIPYSGAESINAIFGEIEIEYNKIGHYFEKLNGNIFDHFNFCSIRNPWERMVLEYEDNNKDIDFIDYIKNPIVSNYKDWYTYDNKNMVHHILKYEDIDNDFSYACGRLGIHNIKLDINKEKINYQKYYNSESKDIIFNLFKKEITTHNYEF